MSKEPKAARVVTNLCELEAKPAAQDAQLRTGSDTINQQKKDLKGSNKPLKAVFSGWSRGSDSIFGSWSLTDCTFQFLTVYISVYDSSASHVLGLWKGLSEDHFLTEVFFGIYDNYQRLMYLLLLL